MKRISDLCNPQTNQNEPKRSQGQRYGIVSGSVNTTLGSSSLRAASSFHFSPPDSQSPLFIDNTSNINSFRQLPPKNNHSSTSKASEDLRCTKISETEDLATSDRKRRNSINIISNQCERCGRIFNRRADMLKHVRVVHDRVKDFECAICGRKFGRKDYLSKHVRALHEMKGKQRLLSQLKTSKN